MANLYIKRLNDNARIPERMTEHSACYDIFANLKDREVTCFTGLNVKWTQIPINAPLTLAPNERAIIPTGLDTCTDPDYKINILPRSGKAISQGLTLINCVGIIDADYREELGVLLINTSDTEVRIKDEQRIAQLELAPVEPVLMILGELPKTKSNRNGGMGSTDKKT